MTPTPDLSTEAAPAKADDPATIDLDVLIDRLHNWKEWEKVGYTRDLINKITIAAIEALRERVAGYDTLFDLALKRESQWIEAWQEETGKQNTLPDYGVILAWICDRAETAQALVAVLTKALAFYRDDDERAVEGGILESVSKRPATAALAAMPTEALERAKAVEAKDYAAGLEAAAEIAETIDSGRGNEKEIAKSIRALGKEGP